ncbi:hypothetical protein E2C01_009547 [Portunus trituberculatus]|uniref:Uncharacterized protein n=1 Tax=Portunus trituberculatus TaxID=210409 RepID=A0A5B7D637_PORTR|nr:hypothetical protein [Portunus trituberculatus]
MRWGACESMRAAGAPSSTQVGSRVIVMLSGSVEWYEQLLQYKIGQVLTPPSHSPSIHIFGYHSGLCPLSHHPVNRCHCNTPTCTTRSHSYLILHSWAHNSQTDTRTGHCHLAALHKKIHVHCRDTGGTDWSMPCGQASVFHGTLALFHLHGSWLPSLSGNSSVHDDITEQHCVCLLPVLDILLKVPWSHPEKFSATGATNDNIGLKIDASTRLHLELLCHCQVAASLQWMSTLTWGSDQ